MFWLGLVFSWMPLERSEIIHVLADAKTSFAAHVAAAAAAGCADSAVTCGAVLVAADRAVAAVTQSSASEPIASVSAKAGSDAPSKTRRAVQHPSANSLTASDLAPSWRGRKAKSGA
jgi:hypothetical protein